VTYIDVRLSPSPIRRAPPNPRTTLSIDDDVLLAVKERARRENRTAGEVLSELARQALTKQQSSAGSGQGADLYGFEPFEHRGPAVSTALVDRLRDEEAV